MTYRRIVLLTMVLLCSGAAELTAAPAALAAAEKTYNSKLSAIDNQHMQTLANAIHRYKADIEAFAAQSKRVGDLNAKLAANKEIEDYGKAGTIPEESAEPGLPAAILVARTKYHETVANAAHDKNRNILALADQYTKYLESLQKQLVISDKIEDAVAVKKAIEAVQSSAPVTAAKFAVADNSTRSAPTETAPTEPAAAEAAPEYDTIEYSKKIGARGNLMHDWSATTLRLQAGDEVSVRANGSWQCTYMDRACGPAGYPYANPTAIQFRRDPTLNYGALICKYGTKGAIINVGEAATFTSDAGGVLLYFDANILPGRTHRRDCAGELVVNVTVKRKKQ